MGPGGRCRAGPAGDGGGRPSPRARGPRRVRASVCVVPRHRRQALGPHRGAGRLSRAPGWRLRRPRDPPVARSGPPA